MPTILELNENYHPNLYIPHTEPTTWPPYESALTLPNRQRLAANLVGQYFSNQVEALYVRFQQDRVPRIIEPNGPLSYTFGQVRALSLLTDDDFLCTTNELCYEAEFDPHAIPVGDWETTRNVYDLILTGQAIAAIRRCLISEIRTIVDAYQIQYSLDPQQETYASYLRHGYEFYAALSDRHIEALSAIREDWDARYLTITPPYQTNYPIRRVIPPVPGTPVTPPVIPGYVEPIHGDLDWEEFEFEEGEEFEAPVEDEEDPEAPSGHSTTEEEEAEQAEDEIDAYHWLVTTGRIDRLTGRTTTPFPSDDQLARA